MREKNCEGEIEKGTGVLVGGLVGGESGHLEGAKVVNKLAEWAKVVNKLAEGAKVAFPGQDR